MKAVHFVSRKEGISLHGMSRWQGAPAGFRSCCWLISDDEAADLLGGWVYFHQSKADPSIVGGRILGFEPGASVSPDMAARKVILFQSDPDGRGRSWRGADHGMAYTSGIIAGDLPHEQATLDTSAVSRQPS